MRIFLCHASGDKEEVRNLYRRLQQDGLDPWLDEENLLPGQDWQRQIPQAVIESDVVIVALSHNSINTDGYIREEIRFALDAAKRLPDDTIYIIPLKLEECEVPKQLARKQWVDLYRSNGYEKLIRALQVRARETGAKPPVWKSGMYNYVSQPEPEKSSSWFPRLTVGMLGTLLTILITALAVGNDFVGLWDRFMSASGAGNTTRPIILTPVATVAPALTPVATVAPALTAGVTYVSPADGAVYRYVPAGEFIMGSEDGQNDESPQRTVYLDDYWIMETEVTNAQYRKFMDAGGYTTEAYWDLEGWTWRTENDIIEPQCWNSSNFNGRQQPVVCVSWYEAEAYGNWLSAETGLDFGLPTEAQWEKAARGTDGRVYPWGNDWDGNRVNYCDKSCTYDWADKESDDGYQYTAPIGSYPTGASPYGTLDMAGNVWEWTADWYADDYYKNSPERNPTGPESGDRRVLRGGSWFNRPDYVRAADRDWSNPDQLVQPCGVQVVVVFVPRLTLCTLFFLWPLFFSERFGAKPQSPRNGLCLHNYIYPLALT